MMPDPKSDAGGRSAGLTLIELTVTLAIISILATGILPLSQVTYKRVKEMELRRNLRVIRDAIDRYKQFADEGKIKVEAFSTGYPETLAVLVEGAELAGPAPTKQKFLRRIPKDPMTEDGRWGLRAYADAPDSAVWGGQDVYDVYTKSNDTALDGTAYSEW